MQNQPIKAPVISPEIQEKIKATQDQQRADDQIGLQAATAATPGPLADVWAPEPDKVVGPYKVRRFVDGDFIRLSIVGHKLNSFKAVTGWLENPEPSGHSAWILNWLMTHTVAECKEAVKNVEKLKSDAEAEFEDRSGMQLALVMRAIVEQIAVYLGTRIEYKHNEEGLPAGAIPPQSSQPS